MDLLRYIYANLKAVAGLWTMISATITLLICRPILPSIWLTLLAFAVVIFLIVLMRKIIYTSLEIDARRRGQAFFLLLVYLLPVFLIVESKAWFHQFTLLPASPLGVVTTLAYTIVIIVSILMAAPLEKYQESV